MAAQITIGGIFRDSSGTAQNSVTVDAWKASRFSSPPPAYNAAAPAGSADASATTGTSFGQAGAWELTLPTPEVYYIRAQYGGNSYWIRHNAVGYNKTDVSGHTGSGRVVLGMGISDSSLSTASDVLSIESPSSALLGTNLVITSDSSNSPIFATGITGGAAVYGDNLGQWGGVFSPQVVLDKYGHLTTENTGASASAGSGAGTSPPAPTIVGTDVAGVVLFGSGSSPTGGPMVDVTFQNAYKDTSGTSQTPVVLLTPNNDFTYLEGIYVASRSSTGFSININNGSPPANQSGTTWAVLYMVMNGVPVP